MIDTRVWRRTLGDCGQEPFRDARERLRSAYTVFRERASLIAGEIARDLPDFTVHDGTHLDALWEMVDLVTPDAFLVTPAEAFVLGGAILIHDLGMGVAAYVDGLAALRSTDAWKDARAALRFERTSTDPSADLERRADAIALRLLHARHAERLCSAAWQAGGTTYHLIEVPELRDVYGGVIGRIAHSHWWPVSELPHGLPQMIGPCPWMPPEWTVDAVKVACLLRVADAAHLDTRRAPPFLMALRRTTGMSRAHWEAQSKLQRPTRDHERLVYSAGAGFGIDEADGWWVCHDLLRVLDHELRDVDLLLIDTHRAPLAAKGVLGIDDPDRLAKLVPAIGWKPIDAHVKVSDVPALVQALGGEALYGNNSPVALRELIQNASDAVRARRLLEDRPVSWGKIDVRLLGGSEASVLEVSDTGIGMSARTLATSLLDFGSSYWRTEEAREEHPGLLARGFVPTGRYGIGFYSVFMVGDRVSVVSRRADDAPRDTNVLEFRNGLRSRPVLRAAKDSERLRDPGTVVRIELKAPLAERGGLLYRSAGEPYTLADLVAKLAPALDVDIEVESEEGNRTVAIRAHDWVTLPAVDLMRRTVRVAEGRLDQHGEASVLAGADRVRSMIEDDGTIVGRGCIPVGRRSSYPIPNGCVVVDGLESCPTGLWGIFVGKAITAARDAATPVASRNAARRWAEEQAVLIEQMAGCPTEDLVDAATFLRAFGLTGKLPIARARGGWVDYGGVESIAERCDVLVLVNRYTIEMRDDELDPIALDDGVLVVGFEGQGMFSDNELGWPDSGVDDATLSVTEGAARNSWTAFYTKTLFGAVVEAVAGVWGATIEDLLGTTDWPGDNVSSSHRIGVRRRRPVKAAVDVVLRRPRRSS